MSCRMFFRIFPAIIIFFIIPFTVKAGEPTERIKKATDKLIEIVMDHELDAPVMAAKRAEMIRAAVDEIFDWEAFSQRALSKYWLKRTSEEKKEFINLFGQLLERTYMDKTRQYSGEKVVFLGESVDGEYGVVKAKILDHNEREVMVDYRVEKKDGDWFVYDVMVEGVSLVNNYRVQFNDIIMKSSYEELVSRLKTKLAEK